MLLTSSKNQILLCGGAGDWEYHLLALEGGLVTARTGRAAAKRGLATRADRWSHGAGRASRAGRSGTGTVPILLLAILRIGAGRPGRGGISRVQWTRSFRVVVGGCGRHAARRGTLGILPSLHPR